MYTPLLIWLFTVISVKPKTKNFGAFPNIASNTVDLLMAVLDPTEFSIILDLYIFSECELKFRTVKVESSKPVLTGYIHLLLKSMALFFYYFWRYISINKYKKKYLYLKNWS